MIERTTEDRSEHVARIVLGGYAAAQIVLVVFLFANHARFPLFLDLMEGGTLQHFRRAAAFEPIYPEPTPEYVPLAYNAFYYVFAVPVSWVFGANLFTLRLVAFLGTVVSGLIIGHVVRRETASKWWGLIAVGLFAAAYRVMDAYLDTAHSDSWLVASALLGSYLIGRSQSRGWTMLGVVMLAASFWFKQHGALFAIGGVAFVTWRDGLRRSLPCWVVAIMLGPALYVFAGPSLFGSHFHYFTWEVPRRWSELSLRTFYVYLGFIAISYPILAASAAVLTVWTRLRDRAKLNIWHVQFVAAALTGLMGALDPGCSFNVFIPMGAWFILVGTLGLATLVPRVYWAERYRAHWLALVVTFAALAYDPRSVMTSPRAEAAYDDLLSLLHDLDGSVYAPSLGQLEKGYRLYPAAHWVPLEDMVRGPGRETRDQPIVRRLLAPTLPDEGPAYILANQPLDIRAHFLGWLQDHYKLVDDFGDRFKPLSVLPGRYDHGWPRYLYRYSAEQATRPAPITNRH